MSKNYTEYLINSASQRGKQYSVKRFDVVNNGIKQIIFKCDCPYFLLKCKDNMTCKHINGVIGFLGIGNKIKKAAPSESAKTDPETVDNAK